jgi:hypothetical protein
MPADRECRAILVIPIVLFSRYTIMNPERVKFAHLILQNGHTANASNCC